MGERELRDAALLKAAWARVESTRAISKKAMAADWGVTPSAVSQYINGNIALNLEAQLWFSRYLDIPPGDIWPDFKFTWVAPNGIPPSSVDVAVTFSRLRDDVKGPAKAMLEAMPQKKAAG